MTHYLAISCLTCYLAASVSYLLSIALKRTGLSPVGKFFLIAGFCLQTILIWPFLKSSSSFIPENRGEYFFWSAWALPLLTILAGKRLNFPLVGAFIAPAAAFFLSASSYLAHQYQSGLVKADNTLLLVHVVPAFLAELCLVLAFILSCVFLIQDRRIKSKSATAISVPGPSLEALESINQRILYVGFISMTFAILTGTIWALSSHAALFAGDFYQWISLVVWLLLGLAVHVRSNLQWSAKRQSKLTILVTSLLLTSILLLVVAEGNSIHGTYGF